MSLFYAITRSAIEHFRGDAIRGTWFGDTLSTSQLISIAVAVVSVTLLIRFRSRREPVPPSRKG